MNAFVQTLVWTTMAGFLYILWLDKQVTSPIHAFERSRHLRRVLNSLQTLWVIVSLSVIFSVLLVSLPPLAQAARPVAPLCSPATSLQATSLPYAYASISAVCRTIEPVPTETYPATQDSGNGPLVTYAT